jgi:hypothetical protein
MILRSVGGFSRRRVFSLDGRVSELYLCQAERQDVESSTLSYVLVLPSEDMSWPHY